MTPPLLDLPEGVHPWKDPGRRKGLELEGPGGRARLTLTGAHIQSFEDPEHGELLFMSQDAGYGEGVASRGGIPIVFPWFGGHANRADAPAHGFARTRTWEVIAAGPGPAVTLGLQGQEPPGAPWPHAYELRYEVSVAEGLQVTLRVRNAGGTPLRFEEALHTYLDVGAIETATVHGLESTPFTEFAGAPRTEDHDAPGPITFPAETDRVYQDVPEAIELAAPALSRRVTLTTEGARSAIVWNPWSAKAAAMGQLRNDEWQRFVCIESANCKERFVELAPGKEHALSLGCRAAR